jgi:hypothetical protein
MNLQNIIIISIISIFIGCKNENPKTNNQIEIQKLTEATIEEFYYTNKYMPVQLEHYKLLMDEVTAMSKEIKQNTYDFSKTEKLEQDLKEFKLLIDKVNKHVRWTDKLINNEFENLINSISQGETKYKNQFNYLEFIVVNEILKSSSYDTYQFENLELGFSHNLTKTKDSLEISVFPKGVIAWYHPLIVINGDTIKESNFTRGTANIKIEKSNNVELKGSYNMRQNFNIYQYPIDTILEINY